MKTLIFITALLLSIATIHAEDEALHTIGFQPLEIHTFKPGATRLIVTDLNGDGLDDVIFANNHISRLEILLRRPKSELQTEELPALEECFDDHGFIVDQRIQTLRVTDLNGDGLDDIAILGSPLGLQLRYQLPDGTFAEPERIFIKEISDIATMAIEDLNGDGQNDILICHRSEAELLWNSSKRPFSERKTLPFAADNCYHANVADINGDALPDLIFHFNTTANPLKIRYGKGEGHYGIEQPVDLPPRQYMDIMFEEDGSPRLAMILKNRLACRLYEFIEEVQPPVMEAQEIAPLRISLEGTGKKNPPAWIRADLNDDAYDDLLVAAPELSRLHLYSGGPEGLDPEPKHFDSLSEVERISHTAGGNILVISPREKIAALHKAGNMERFPRILKTPGDVLAGSTVASAEEAWLVCKDADKKLQLASIPLEGESESVTYPLDMLNEPTDLLAFRLPDQQTGIILFMPYDTPKMLIVSENGTRELTSESFRALTQSLTAGSIRFDRPGDGSALTVTQGAIARRFEWAGDHYEAARQFNPENPTGELVASCEYNLRDGSSGTLFYDRSSSDLVHFSAEGENWGKIHIPDADQTIFNLVQLSNPDHDVFVLLDRTGISEIVGEAKQLKAEALVEYASPAEEPLLAYGIDVDLGKPPQSMMALVDAANRSIEIVREVDGALKRELSFEVFLVSDFADVRSSRTTEPHDLESGDLNGDGVGDLVLLCHDKLIIYLGE
ncbi:MAG: VCBS repeat-containing protein [Pontiellaceae bacterium]|nr:VCBS repeat-containing protein [Pontiellaceae bacterium]MBN2785330.1 VCBS repeat-containing protein [Pontiellaceae bacterium]